MTEKATPTKKPKKSSPIPLESKVDKGQAKGDQVQGSADSEIADVDKDSLTQMLQAAVGPTNPLHRCGTVAIVGKPNVGKSTLLNALVGQKISITSKKAQTTRHRITGIRTEGASQFIFVDTPGFQTRHSNALNTPLY